MGQVIGIWRFNEKDFDFVMLHQLDEVSLFTHNMAVANDGEAK